MKVIRINSSGVDVRKWQIFLTGLGYQIIVDSKFGPGTDKATKKFQQENGLTSDGEVGMFTYTKAIELGFNFSLTDPTGESDTSINWPPKPSFQTLSNLQQRFGLFGRFEYDVLPNRDITIKGNWTRENITSTIIPVLKNIPGGPSDGKVWFHKKAVPQLESLFHAWEREGLLDLLKTWGGSFYPRLVKGESRSISNHSFGTAFDINVAWNGLNVIPPIVGKLGSVRKLVPLANQHGFFWGGHYRDRLDGMHFEVARIF